MSTMPAAAADPSVSVIICAYTDRRWALLAAAVESVLGQDPPPDELVLVIDHNAELLERARAGFPHARVVANDEETGLSGARNTGVRKARGDVLVFLDDDAEAQPGWLAALLDAFGDSSVIGAGGVADAVWEDDPPRWLPPEFLWVVGASYVGLPGERVPVRNPIGATMAFRRTAFELAGGFTDGIGRVGRTPLGCEETEFAIRVRQLAPETVVLHVPEARVDHHIASERGSWRYFVSRCWAEGLSKAVVAGLVGPTAGLESERVYVRRTLPAGFAAGLRAGVRGDASGLGRSLAIAAGLAITSAGYLRGRMAVRRGGGRAGL
jgi:GT2 family glycosyltransferase